jgi:hypothetical protein
MESPSNSIRSWLANFGAAVAGIFLGWIPFLGAMVLLFWNEVRTVRTERALNEGATEVISIPVDSIAPGNDGRLVHVQGLVSTTETLHDPLFKVSVQGLRLRRVVEMYQWRETAEQQPHHSNSSAGRRPTTYRYDQTWSESVVDSTHFRTPAGHENPTSIPFQGAEWSALKFHMGAFRLESTLRKQLKHFEPLMVRVGEPAPEVRAAGFRPAIYSFYFGDNPTFPQVGDVRVVFEWVGPTEVSIIAGQAGHTLDAYQTRTGGKLDLLRTGRQSPAEMFKDAHFWNWLIKWACRIGGYLLMILAVRMVLRPLNLAAGVLPASFSGLASASSFLGFIFASGLTLMVASLTWVAYRPHIGLPLLLDGLLLGLLVIWISERRHQTETA